MILKNITLATLLLILLTSCVSQKEYATLQKKYEFTSNELLTYKSIQMSLENEIALYEEDKKHAQDYVNLSQTYFNGMLASLDSKKLDNAEVTTASSRLTFKNIPNINSAYVKEFEKAIKKSLEHYITEVAGLEVPNDAIDITITRNEVVIDIDHDFMTQDTNFVDSENPNNVFKYLSDSIVANTKP